MSRDDSFLNTGMTSRSFANPRVEKQKAERREEQALKRLKLSPVGDILQEQFQKEVQSLMYAPYKNEDEMSDEQFRTERRARRLAIASLLAIQTRLNIILKEPRTEKPQTEAANE